MKLHVEILRYGERASIKFDLEADPVEATQPHIRSLVEMALTVGADVRLNGETP